MLQGFVVSFLEARRHPLQILYWQITIIKVTRCWAWFTDFCPYL